MSGLVAPTTAEPEGEEEDGDNSKSNDIEIVEIEFGTILILLLSIISPAPVAQGRCAVVNAEVCGGCEHV